MCGFKMKIKCCHCWENQFSYIHFNLVYQIESDRSVWVWNTAFKLQPIDGTIYNVITENCCTTEEKSRNFPGCFRMNRHSMGFSDDRHHPVGIQKGLIGADSDGESEHSPEQDMLLHRHLCVAVKHFLLCVGVKHFLRSWRKCLTATQRMRTSVDKCDLYTEATYICFFSLNDTFFDKSDLYSGATIVWKIWYLISGVQNFPNWDQ